MIRSPRVGKLKQRRKAWIAPELVLGLRDLYSFMYSGVSRNRKRGLVLFLVGHREACRRAQRALAEDR